MRVLFEVSLVELASFYRVNLDLTGISVSEGIVGRDMRSVDFSVNDV